LRSFYAAIPKGALFPEMGNKHKVLYEMGDLGNSGWVLCKGIDHAGTYVMFLKSLLSIAETPCLGTIRREMVGASPALNCIL
jgi:hypothetical protein